MRKLIVPVGVVLLPALTAHAPPAEPGGSIDVHGVASTFIGTLQKPEIATSPDSVTVEGADATFRSPLQEP